jgi:hypothetical protein
VSGFVPCGLRTNTKVLEEEYVPEEPNGFWILRTLDDIEHEPGEVLIPPETDARVQAPVVNVMDEGNVI